MAQPNTLNPYPLIGAQVTAGLNFVIAAAPVTIDDLVNAVGTYIAGVYYPAPTVKIQMEIRSVAYNAINSYRNNLVLSGNAMYSDNQAPFLQMLIGPSMTTSLSPDSFADRVADIEDNIGTSDLPISDQGPLFLTTISGSAANAYWLAEIALGAGSLWFGHFSTNSGQNYMNTLQWSAAAMNGALAGYGATPLGLIEPTTNVVTTNMVSALIGALTVTAGKVIFNWIPRITKPLQLNVEKISNLNQPPLPNQIDTATAAMHSQVFCGSKVCDKSAGAGHLICIDRPHYKLRVLSWWTYVAC